jgi:YidC/Oxa1 family membrane protein insertase
MQQKLLMYGMPIMFGFFSIWFPAGLTLYIFTNTVLTLVHHFFVHREDRERIAAEKKGGKVVASALDRADDDDDDDEPVATSAAKPKKSKSKSKSSKPKSSKSEVKAPATRSSAASKSTKSRNRNRNRGKKGNKKGGRK